MSLKNRTRFDIAALRQRAGPKVFARGENYHRDGRVEILVLEPRRVLAEVLGTEDYRTVLTGRGTNLGGECSCPAFEDSDFCKHMVAVALAANEADGGAEADGEATLSQIKRYLKGKDHSALVEMIVEVAERDHALLRKLALVSATAGGNRKAFGNRLRKAIDNATRVRGYVEYAAVPGWASSVEDVLDMLAQLASSKQAPLALELCERVVERIEKAIPNMDDSDGYCSGLLERARDVHIAAALVAKPDPLALARNLFAREMANAYGTFNGSASAYAKVLGKSGLQEFRRLAAAAWDKLPARQAGRSVVQDDGDYHRLRSILDVYAERDGDVAARIALRAKDLSTSWSYLQLAEFCLSQSRKEEALQWAEDGLFMFEDERPDERLIFFVVDLLEKAGRTDDATAHLWRAFEKHPSFELYARLRKLAGTAARERVLRQLRARAAKAQRARWHYPAELLVEILIHERMFDAAWTTVQADGASIGMREKLARASEATHPAQALTVYAERVEALAAIGGDPAYKEAAALVAHMAQLRGACEQDVYVSDLKVRLGRKRKFMALLG